MKDTAVIETLRYLPSPSAFGKRHGTDVLAHHINQHQEPLHTRLRVLYMTSNYILHSVVSPLNLSSLSQRHCFHYSFASCHGHIAEIHLVGTAFELSRAPVSMHVFRPWAHFLQGFTGVVQPPGRRVGTTGCWRFEVG
jgi:hypothetical protein